MTRLVPIAPATSDASLTPPKSVPWPWEIDGAGSWSHEDLAAYYRNGWAQCQVREIALQDDIRDSQAQAEALASAQGD